MSLTLGQIKEEIRRTFGDEAAVQVTDGDIVTWVNAGQREVISMNPELLEAIVTADTVAGQAAYVIPPDVRKIRSIYYKNDTMQSYEKIQGYSLQEFDTFINGWNGTAYGESSRPLAYHTFANNILIFPTPDQSTLAGLKLYYYRMPTDLAADVDVVDLPANYHSAIVQYVLKRAYELDENLEWVGAKSTEFTASVSGQRVQEKDNASDTYTRISVCIEDEECY